MQIKLRGLSGKQVNNIFLFKETNTIYCHNAFCKMGLPRIYIDLKYQTKSQNIST